MAFNSLSSPANAYAQVGIESSVHGSDPHHLILLLFRGAESGVALAKECLRQNNIDGKNKAIRQAIQIINEGLSTSLDREAGGNLVEKLSALYDYMCLRLLRANLKNDIEALDEVATLLAEIRSGWEEISPTSAPTGAKVAA